MSDELLITPTEIDTPNLEKYKQAFEANDMPMALPKLQWQHNHYLKKSFISWIIDSSSRVAGLYSSFFVDFLVEQKKRIAAQSIDTLTDINYRGKGLFTKLASDVNKRLAADNTPFIYGFPNSSSAPGFFKKLGWKKIGDGTVPFIVRPVRLGFVIQKLLKKESTALRPVTDVAITNKNIKPITSFNADVNAIADVFLKTKKYAICRDSNYLNWRFIQKPGEDYKIYGYYDSNNVLKGFVVYTVKQKHGGNIGYIMELMYDTADAAVGKQLLKQAVKAIKKSGADLILAWSFKDAPGTAAYKSNYFFTMPEKLKTIQLFFGACLFDTTIEEASFFNASNWYISYCDSDTV
jgi:hypothetical protein